MRVSLKKLFHTFKIKMCRQKDPTSKIGLFDRLGSGSGTVFNTFFISELFDLGIRSKPFIIANSRIFGGRLSDIKRFRCFGPGFSSSVHKRLKQGTPSDKEHQKQQADKF